ncbi:MAG TPA: Asp-tRNA(Asn)/Glu-tRNA(Gln) amidotransferase subunit GatB, partial [Candidatus Krumholzibacterium sp.]|nr:Asp-tRNA(Asn)/Glu-tRNA(Gln) amidotransferase subunit GatB [Candidatus Krumholzibacterium sp.]
MRFETVIGLEVHAQLLTRTKLFCRCRSRFGDEPNTNVCPVCLGLPGSLPVVNQEAVRMSVLLGTALGCSFPGKSEFARKSYFYPDCPRNYQISMYGHPICVDGSLFLETDDGERPIGIERIHLEDDAGKLIHDDRGYSLVDFNRCGVPLVEIVTKPELRSPEEAASFMRALRQLLRYIGICDGNLEAGSMRCDVNVSLRPEGSAGLGDRTEIKNLNSFKAVREGIAAEVERQAGILEHGGKVEQLTFLWDAGTRTLTGMRTKEEAHDYRYFPEPDLQPLYSVRSAVADDAGLPELPRERRKRFE